MINQLPAPKRIAALAAGTTAAAGIGFAAASTAGASGTVSVSASIAAWTIAVGGVLVAAATRPERKAVSADTS